MSGVNSTSENVGREVIVPPSQITVTPRPIRPLRPLAAWLTKRLEGADDADYRWHKRALFADLGGTVVEIGPGTGANLAYLPREIALTAIEPSPDMRRYLEARAVELGRLLTLLDGTAERLPLPDASVDAVVGTLVLCSVADPATTLAEVRRVLKPGGRFLFIEHVAAPRGSWLRRVQWLARPLYACCLDGCHTDRETWRTIADAGFARVQLAHFRTHPGVTAPHIVGVATAG
jgi:ubiquinone/menaquinone biosynthesis C-methylase UbiE